MKASFSSMGIALGMYIVLPDVMDKAETAVFLFSITFLCFVLITGWSEAFREMVQHREEISLRRSREKYRKPEYGHPDLITLGREHSGLFEELPDGTTREVPLVTLR